MTAISGVWKGGKFYAGELTLGGGMTVTQDATGRNIIGASGGVQFNVVDAPYNAIGDGVADDTVALQAAFDDAAAIGGTVYVPQGTYNYTQLDFGDIQNVLVTGEGSSSAGGVPALVCIASGAGYGISLGSSQGVTFRRMKLRYTDPAFTGVLVKTGWGVASSDSAYLVFEQVTFEGWGGADGAAALIDLSKSIIVAFRDVAFRSAVRACIRNTGEYSNVVSWDNCTFNDFASAPLLNPGESWAIRTCTFEPLADGTAGAVEAVSNDISISFAYQGNWHGDVSAAGGNWITIQSLGSQITANYFAPALGTGYAIGLKSGTQGCFIAGNYTGTTVGIKCLAAPILGLVVIGNDFNSVTPIENVHNASRPFIHGNNNYNTDGISVDRGDASVTLTVGVDVPLQQFLTDFTATRTATLSNLIVYVGASFRIVKKCAGVLDIGPGIRTVPANQEVVAEYTWDGNVGWVETLYAEIAAAGTAPIVLNVKAAPYNAVGDGSADDTAAIQAAWDDASVVGGTVYFPPGLYLFTALDFEDGRNVQLLGESSGATIVSGTEPQLVCTASGAGNAIALGSCRGVAFRRLRVRYNNAGFTGTLIKTGRSSGGGDAANLTFEQVALEGAGVSGAAALVDVGNASVFAFRDCSFQNAVRAINRNNGESTTVLGLETCTFANCGSVPVRNPEISWTIRTCKFFPLTSGQAGAVVYDLADHMVGFIYEGNWHGNVATSGGNWISIKTLGGQVVGNLFGDELGTGYAIGVQGGTQGLFIGGNRTDTAVGINFLAATSLAVAIVGNDLQSATPIANVGNATTPLIAANTNYADTTISDATTVSKGIIQLAGDLTGTAAAPLVANGVISYAKIQSVTASRLLGRDASGGGSVQELSLGSGLTLSGTTLSSPGQVIDGFTDQNINASESALLTRAGGINGAGLLMPRFGTLTTMFAIMPGAITAGQLVLTVVLNGSDTGFVITLNSGSSNGSVSGSLSLTVGDTVQVRGDADGSFAPGASAVNVSLVIA